MKLLLDTHVLVWMVSEPDRLSATARAAVLDEDNELHASHASLWELAIKAQSRPAFVPDLTTVEKDLEHAGVSVWLPIKPAHIFGVLQLPLIHRDPFDRLLISQARLEGLTLVTCDSSIQKYSASTLW